jgi:hypothetical protein
VLKFSHAVAFRCVTHIHSSQVSAIDERAIPANDFNTGGVHRPHPTESHTTGLGMADPKVRLWEFTTVNEYACS